MVADKGSPRHHGASTHSGTKVTASMIDDILKDEASKITSKFGDKQTETARAYLSAQVHAPILSDFLTSDMMDHLDASVNMTPR